MRIQHNIMAMNAYRNYTNNVSAMKKNLEKLSSGYKINRAGDDAAGLAISEKMRAQITGLETAQKNAKDGISLVQTAEGALTEVHDMLNRMVELATQSANGTYDNETDRFQMQKEVDQLLSEINRIADSSNFNGINLLDGTLGLNTDAFTVTGTADAVAAVTAGTSAAKLTNIHGGSGVSFAKAEFKVDLKNLEVKTAATTDKIDIKIGNTTLTSASLSTAGTKTAAEVAAKIAAAYTGTSSAKTVTIEGLNFKVTANASVLTFTQVQTKGAAATATSVDPDVAKAFNEKMQGATVTAVDRGNAKVQNQLNYDHAINWVTKPTAKVDAGMYGADWDLTGLVANGNSLTIGTATYTFKMTDADSTLTTNGTVTIDTRKFTTASQQMAEAIRLLSSANNSKIDIGAKDGTTLHVDVKSTTVQGTLGSVDDFKDLFKASVSAADAKNAGTKLAVNDANIKEGNVISVGTNKFVQGKDFTDAASLKTAIEGKGYTVESAKGTGDYAGQTILTIRAKTAEDAAPTVLGKGLTLQIGDTSDSYNQLNVAVQDMHAESIGIGGLKIDTEEQAQAAVNKIKAAINTVSDVRGTLGATQNRLDHTINNLSVMTENIQDAESTIRDTDVAEEMMAYTKNNILIQSAQAMLAQANQVPQGVLQLLQ